MNRSAKLLLALALTAAAIPAAASAQQAKPPKDNKYTKNATKYMTVAELKQNPQEQATLYQQALASLKQGMAKDPQNAKVWLLTGEIYAHLGQFPQADSAFHQARKLYEAYGPEIEGAREQAWLKEFQKGTQYLDSAQKVLQAQALSSEQRDSANKAVTELAVEAMNKAESIYSARPEAQLNLGVIYLNSGRPDEAATAFKLAKARLNGPLQAKLKPADKAQWQAWDQLIDVTMAQIEGNKGIDAFQKQAYDSAAVDFQKALQINPHARDYAYNLAEAIFARTGKLEQQRRAAESAKPVNTAEVKKIDAEAAPLYEQLIQAAEAVKPFDPGNTDIYVMIARAYKGEADAASGAAQKKELQNKALAALTAAQKLPFEVTDLTAAFGDTSKLAGKIKNHTLKAGEPAKLKVSFVGVDGSVLGTADVSVAAPAADSTVDFEAAAPTKGQVAGWKYEYVQQ